MRDKFGRLRQGVANITYGNPLYSLMLGGKAPTALAIVPPDPWPGDVAHGNGILAGQFRLVGQVLTLEPTATPDWQATNASSVWLDALNGFDWMRDLRAVGGDNARRRARALVSSWLNQNPNWNARSWSAKPLAARIANWIGLHDFYCASADDEFRARVFESLARQYRHLIRVVPGGLDGEALIVAIKGLIYGAFCLDNTGRTGGDALSLLERELPRQILPDGGHIERNPSAQLRILRDLIDIRAVLRTARVEVPEALQHAIDRMTPALRFFRHGDGGLALFNGSSEEDPALVDTVLAQADARGRPLKSAPHTGFERLIAGRTLVLMDTGVQPDGLDHNAHAGTLSLEVSIGKERLIVNCGAHPGAGGPWRLAMAGTAAHSTLVLADTNSAEVQPDGGLGRRPTHVGCERQEADGAVLVIAAHNGYGKPFGLLHRRRIYLADNGEDLRGEDALEPVIGTTAQSQSYVIRFHLHPSVHIIHDGPRALLTLPSGAVWRMTTSGGTMAVEESIYLGQGGEQTPSHQLTISGHGGADASTIKWALRRERKGA